MIDRTEPVPYTSKSDKKQTGTVSARVVDYKVQAHSNGASYEISSAEEEHPLLNYADITYLSVTERFMIDIFDWYYTLNAENGLWIDTTKGSIHQTLDVVLEALSEKYAAGGTYRGTLTGKGDTVLFHATVQTEKHVNKDVFEFSASPFPFFKYGKAYIKNYLLNDGGMESEGQFITAYESEIMKDPNPYQTEPEKLYIGECFLDLQFAGKRADRVLEAKELFVDGKISTWKLKVSYNKETFSGYTALVSIDLLKKSVEQIAILTDNYVLTMVP